MCGVDNSVFRSIYAGPGAENRLVFARRLCRGLPWMRRLSLLTGLVWFTKLTTPLFEIFDLEVSWRDIILMGGGLFLLVKATSEIHGTVEGGHGSGHGGGKTTSFAAAIAQILAIDIVFSLDRKSTRLNSSH